MELGGSQLKTDKSKHGGCSTSVSISTPTVTLVEQAQDEIEQFLAMLRFENHNKLEELPGVLK